jgi:hypothetical protein
MSIVVPTGWSSIAARSSIVLKERRLRLPESPRIVADKR